MLKNELLQYFTLLISVMTLASAVVLSFSALKRISYRTAALLLFVIGLTGLCIFAVLLMH